eukprot:TRINITY_DN151_c0_g1_i1.p1 TRINITY_DN151_c0_g1~~TRINITY_DN151_c0_g1_i1.p1  ORF type:complete len:347 (-),score=105.98 TRINITY_DN151_c0_g1_i1:1398-2378(-)
MDEPAHGSLPVNADPTAARLNTTAQISSEENCPSNSNQSEKKEVTHKGEHMELDKVSGKKKKHLKKKLKRKQLRQELALQEQVVESDPTLVSQREEEERLRAEAEEREKVILEIQRKAWEEREKAAQIIWEKQQEEKRLQDERKKAEAERRQEEELKKAKEAEQRKAEGLLITSEKTPKDQTPKVKRATDANGTPKYSNDFNPAPVSSYGTEKDSFNCSFYLKIGSCRFGDSCGKHHPRPMVAQTILIKNMYDGLGMSEVLDEDGDEDLEHDESEIMKHFREFYFDIKPEFERFGEIIQLKVGTPLLSCVSSAFIFSFSFSCRPIP